MMDKDNERVFFFLAGVVLTTVVLGLLYDARIDSLKYWLEILTAIGTVGAVGFSVWFALQETRRKRIEKNDARVTFLHICRRPLENYLEALQHFDNFLNRVVREIVKGEFRSETSYYAVMDDGRDDPDTAYEIIYFDKDDSYDIDKIIYSFELVNTSLVEQELTGLVNLSSQHIELLMNVLDALPTVVNKVRRLEQLAIDESNIINWEFEEIQELVRANLTNLVSFNELKY